MDILSFIKTSCSTLELVSIQDEKAIVSCTNFLSANLKAAYEDKEGFEDFIQELIADPLGIKIYVLMEKAEEEMDSSYCGKLSDYVPPLAVDRQDTYEEEKQKDIRTLATSILKDIYWM